MPSHVRVIELGPDEIDRDMLYLDKVVLDAPYEEHLHECEFLIVSGADGRKAERLVEDSAVLGCE